MNVCVYTQSYAANVDVTMTVMLAVYRFLWLLIHLWLDCIFSSFLISGELFQWQFWIFFSLDDSHFLITWEKQWPCPLPSFASLELLNWKCLTEVEDSLQMFVLIFRQILNIYKFKRQLSAFG